MTVSIVLSIDELIACGRAVGSDDMHHQLRLPSTHHTRNEASCAIERAHLRLVECGMIETHLDQEWLNDDVAHLLSAITRPDRTITVRGVGSKLLICRTGHEYASVVITTTPDGLEEIACKALGPCDTPESHIGVIRRFIKAALNTESTTPTGAECEPAVFEPMRLPTNDAWKVFEHRYFRGCSNIFEMTVRASIDDVEHDGSATGAVYLAREGVVLSTTKAANDGQKWSTFSSGTQHQMTHAVSSILNSLPNAQ